MRLFHFIFFILLSNKKKDQTLYILFAKYFLTEINKTQKINPAFLSLFILVFLTDNQ